MRKYAVKTEHSNSVGVSDEYSFVDIRNAATGQDKHSTTKKRIYSTRMTTKRTTKLTLYKKTKMTIDMMNNIKYTGPRTEIRNAT